METMIFLGLEVGSWAEILSSLFAGVAMLLIIWQVGYEKRNNIKSNFIYQVIEKQDSIMSYQSKIRRSVDILRREMKNNTKDDTLIDDELDSIVENSYMTSSDVEFSKLVCKKYRVKKYTEVTQLLVELNNICKEAVDSELNLEHLDQIMGITIAIQKISRENISTVVKKL